jgi:hypothetical protein
MPSLLIYFLDGWRTGSNETAPALQAQGRVQIPALHLKKEKKSNILM